MGQKVSPTGFRLGITEDWRSRWYADKDYAQNLANDQEIRTFLKKYLSRAAVSKIEIERAGDKIKVIITTARPGVVIGKKGAEIDQLRKKLETIANGKVSIEELAAATAAITSEECQAYLKKYGSSSYWGPTDKRQDPSYYVSPKARNLNIFGK